jgi:hypothetical protein
MTYVRVQPFEYELFLLFFKVLFAYMFVRDMFLYAIPWAVNLVVKWVESSLVKVTTVAVEFAQDAAEDLVEEIGEAATYAEGMVTRSVTAAARAAAGGSLPTPEDAPSAVGCATRAYSCA